jgi:hypothetical protein
MAPSMWADLLAFNADNDVAGVEDNNDVRGAIGKHDSQLASRST